MTETFCIIGSNSFSGADFIDLLLDEPSYKVFGISRSPEKPANFLRYKRHPNRDNFSFYQYNLNEDTDEIIELIDSQKPEYIINFAALLEPGASWQAPEQWFETNCVALARLINRLKDRDYMKRYVHISTPEVYGSCYGDVREDQSVNPSTPYAASKAGADFFLNCIHKTYGFPLITIRSTNIFGAYQQLFRIIPKAIILLKLGRKIELHGGGKAVKSFIHIRDISKGELTALLNGRIGSIYHLSPKKGISIKDLVRYICDLLGKSFEDNTISVEERPGQDAIYEINSDKARKELGWEPQISLQEGIEEVIKWVDENWEEFSKADLTYNHKF